MTMPCEFLANDGHSSFDERKEAWEERATRLLLAAFPGAVVVSSPEHEEEG